MGNFLDADAGQLVSSAGSFLEHANTFRAQLESCKTTVAHSAAVHSGDSQVAFQQAFHQFQSASDELNQLLNVAQQDITSAHGTYTSADAQHATDMLHSMGAIPTTLPHLA